MYIHQFQRVRPRFERNQESILDWIASAHGHRKDPTFVNKLREKLYAIGLGEKKIQKRGYHLDDCSHKNWSEMQIYNLEDSPQGSLLDQRMAAFDEAASEMFETLYPEGSCLPSHLVHTTCTGYVAPSPAQKLVSNRGGSQTMVTHAYHMGCYGAIPSIRMAMGHSAVENADTDIVHTELCSLHMNPTLHTTEQLVVQSLFADGCIKYTVSPDPCAGFEVKAVLEEVIPNTQTKMTWDLKSWGFHMTISKDIPVLLRRNLEKYLKRLAQKAGIGDLSRARFAIHPGGPKIIEQIADVLELHDEQIKHSRNVLMNYGNMSSATIPHVWQQILEDDSVEDGEAVVSLAFGPGLSISGGVFIKKR